MTVRNKHCKKREEKNNNKTNKIMIKNPLKKPK